MRTRALLAAAAIAAIGLLRAVLDASTRLTQDETFFHVEARRHFVPRITRSPAAVAIAIAAGRVKSGGQVGREVCGSDRAVNSAEMGSKWTRLRLRPRGPAITDTVDGYPELTTAVLPNRRAGRRLMGTSDDDVVANIRRGRGCAEPSRQVRR